MRTVRFGVMATALTCSISSFGDNTSAAKEPIPVASKAKTSAPSCPPADKCAACGSSCGTYPWEGAVEFGVRFSLASVSGPKDVSTAGITFAGSSTQYIHRSVLVLRGTSLFGLGGGTGGLEGALGGSVTGGIRAPVAEHHGPFVRAGIGGELFGNSQFYLSHIDLPLGEVGYQFARNRYVLEIGARVSPTLTGRYNTGDTGRRELGSSFAWAGYLSSLGEHSRFDASFTRFETRQGVPGTPVSVGRAAACGYLIELVALCLDGMYIVGDEEPSPALLPLGAASTSARSFYGGLTVGFISGSFTSREGTKVTPASPGSE